MSDMQNAVWVSTRQGMDILGCCERVWWKHVKQGRITRYSRNMRDNKYLLSEVQALRHAIETRKLRT